VPSEREHLSALFAKLSTAGQADIVLVDAELDAANALPLEAMGEGDIVVQVEDSAESITAAYALIKRLSERYGRRPVERAGHRLPNRARRHDLQKYRSGRPSLPRCEAAIHRVGARMTSTCSARPRLGRTVIDAFPLAGASVAFRRPGWPLFPAARCKRAAGAARRPAAHPSGLKNTTYVHGHKEKPTSNHLLTQHAPLVKKLAHLMKRQAAAQRRGR
jgi:hypothetical protein